MNKNRSYGQPIPDDKLSAFMNVLFNVWFRKHRRLSTDLDFDIAWDELDIIMAQGDQYPVVRHLGIVLLYELDARMHGGYTETTKEKLLELIRSERGQ